MAYDLNDTREKCQEGRVFSYEKLDFSQVGYGHFVPEELLRLTAPVCDSCHRSQLLHPGPFI